MGVKEFFKPTKGKIIIFIVVLVIALFSYSLALPMGKQAYACDPGPCPFTVFNLLTVILAWPALYAHNLIVIIILVAVYDYLLSCIIIFIYKKLHK